MYIRRLYYSNWLLTRFPPLYTSFFTSLFMFPSYWANFSSLEQDIELLGYRNRMYLSFLHCLLLSYLTMCINQTSGFPFVYTSIIWIWGKVYFQYMHWPILENCSISWMLYYVYTLSIYPSVHNQLIWTIFEVHIVCSVQPVS